MKLNAIDRECSVPDGHDRSIFAMSAHFKIRSNRLLVDRKRVIARGNERRGDILKDPSSIVGHIRGLAMDGTYGRSVNPPPKSGPDAMVPATNPQHRNSIPKMSDRIDRHARLGRRSGTRRDDDGIGIDRIEILEPRGVANDDRVGPQSPEGLSQVVDE
jgi:hypothetical protein